VHWLHGCRAACRSKVNGAYCDVLLSKHFLLVICHTANYLYTFRQDSAPARRAPETFQLLWQWHKTTDFITPDTYITRWFKIKKPIKTFNNLFTLVKYFSVKLCKFVGDSYPHISTNFGRFILILHQMALILPRVYIVFTLSNFDYLPRNENAVYHLHRHLKPSMFSSPTKRTFVWIHPSVTRITLCGLVDIKLTLNLIDC